MIRRGRHGPYMRERQPYIADAQRREDMSTELLLMFVGAMILFFIVLFSIVWLVKVLSLPAETQ